jgi:hypothetical protein
LDIHYAHELEAARRELVARDLIAYERGLYQVLDLPARSPPPGACLLPAAARIFVPLGSLLPAESNNPRVGCHPRLGEPERVLHESFRVRIGSENTASIASENERQRQLNDSWRPPSRDFAITDAIRAVARLTRCTGRAPALKIDRPTREEAREPLTFRPPSV